MSNKVTLHITNPDGTDITLNETVEEQAPQIRELFQAGTVNRIVIYRTDGFVVDATLKK